MEYTNTHQEIIYRIADLRLSVRIPVELEPAVLLPSFEAFIDKGEQVQEPVCEVSVFQDRSIEANDSGRLLTDTSEVWGERFRFYELETLYTTSLQRDHDQSLWRMESEKDFSRSSIYMHPSAKQPDRVLSWLLMLAYGQACLFHKTILFHASVISCHDDAVAFLGRSGAGKSTHSRMWLENIQDTQLVNDDNPAIRVLEDGSVYVYGTPWSGKTPCYRQIREKLHAFVRIQKANENEVIWKHGLQAFTCLLPSCTALRWNKSIFKQMNDTLENIIKNVNVTELKCLPNGDAARLCHSELLENKIINL